MFLSLRAQDWFRACAAAFSFLRASLPFVVLKSSCKNVASLPVPLTTPCVVFVTVTKTTTITTTAISTTTSTTITTTTITTTITTTATTKTPNGKCIWGQGVTSPKMRNCVCLYIGHYATRHIHSQAVYASVASSRKPANAVVALTAAIGSGTVGKTLPTLGWRDCRPAQVS